MEGDGFLWRGKLRVGFGLLGGQSETCSGQLELG